MQTTPPPTNPITAREKVLLGVMERIVIETMEYSPERPCSADSYLPSAIIQAAQDALDLYGRMVQPVEVPA